MLSIVLVLLSVVLSLYLYVKRQYSYWKDRGVPFAEPKFPFGTIPAGKNAVSNNDLNVQLFRKYKGTAPFVGLFYAIKPAVLAVDLDFIKRVLITDFHIFHDKGLFFDDEKEPISGHIFNLGGEKWKKLRSKLSPTFTSGKMKLMFPVVVKVGQEFIRVLKSEIKKGNEIEMKEFLSRFTTDVIGNCAFGLEINSLSDPDNEFRRIGKMNFQEPQNSRTKAMLLMVFKNIAKKFNPRTVREEVNNFFTKLVHDTVEYREKNNVQRTDFMDLLIKMKNSTKPEEQITMNEITAQAFVFFMAGHETSSTTMSHAIYELSQNPEAQEKARKCVRDVLKHHSGEFSYESVLEMSYIDYCISESIRKYPPATSTMRVAAKDFEYNGFVIEKGTTVTTSIYALHHDPDHFPEPEKFIPERFEPHECAKRPFLAYLPFGEGPRICLGQRFGQMQARIGLALLLHHFRFTLSSKTEVPLVFVTKGLVMQPRSGLYFFVEDLYV